MRGFILGVRKHRDEDLIVTVLTENRLLELYRFYGVRHSALQLGHKIDFVTENDPFFIPRLRQVSHLGYEWLFDAPKVRAWQQFMQLLHKHLKGAEEIDGFYLALLENAASALRRQHPKRAMIEAAVRLLAHEGRLHNNFRCLLCDGTIDDPQIGLTRALTPVHGGCAYTQGFDAESVKRLFEAGETILFDDEEITRLWRVVEEGL